MPNFLYRARDAQGLLVTGQFEAIGSDELKGFLADRGLIPVSVKERARSLDLTFVKKLLRKRVRPEEVLIMTRQFYSLFKAGMSMEAVLGTLIRQTSNSRLKESLQRIRTAVSSGESLSKAFAAHHDLFGDMYVSMIAAGEEAGILEGVFASLCNLLEKEMEIKSSVKSATLYPKIVVFVLVIATVVIMTTVVPKFASFYAHYKAELPLPTQIVMGLSHFIQSYGYLVGLLGIGCWVAARRYSQTVKGKIQVGDLRFRIPVFGPLNVKVANSRFCHILSALYRSGLPMTRCLEITGGTIGNGAFLREVEMIKGEVTRGKMISEAMSEGRYFTPILIDATAVGEKTGALDEMLETIGTHYDVEVQHTIKNLTTLLEPFLLFFLFGMVACFALAIFLPIWNMSQAVTGH